ncbi:DUF397 domain-containing protein [Actinopolyspora mortivallis]|uniref:DUF397 domain-containing protein n=1 Tax=Actinopolyspora mortivallis TaxID=33906 RepID=A0A2T0GZZ0_ACTMO|nr:DUF397 domain-containing protein [Actinopolyspora mortivallis]PRW64650.1 DUF397 domain-containing protein [Actinopolyspora mortivallis]
MHQPDFTGASWFKSTRSTQNAACVEAAHVPGFTGVRDTKDRDGGTLAIPRNQWAAFLDAVKIGRFE